MFILDSKPETLPGRSSAGTTLPIGPWSVRSSLIWLVLACLLPGIIGAILLFAYEYREGQAQLKADTIQTARALVQAVDNRILRVQALAQGLATANSLADGDFATFHGRARLALAQFHRGISIVLIDPAGRQILNTAEEFGRPLPLHGSQDLVRRVFATGQPAVSDLFVSAVLGGPVVGVGVPVVQGGKVAYALTINVLPDHFNGVLDAQGLPAGWVATVFDRTGTIVARSQEPARFTGRKPADAFLKRFTETDEGSLEAVMKDGVSVVSAFTRSPMTGWRVAISISRQVLTAELTRRLSVLALGVAGLFAAGLGLAWAMGGRIARSFLALKGPAVALGAGQPVRLPATQIKEAAEVVQALGEAARLLAERDAALQALNRTLRSSEEKYRALFTNMAEGFGLGEPVLDEEGRPVDIRYLEVNDAYYRHTGIPRGIEGRPLREVLPRLEQLWIDQLAAVALTGQPTCFVNYNADTRRYYEVYAFSPGPGRFANVFRDVTEQRRMEQALQESESKLRELIATLPGIVWTATGAGAVDFFSRQWLDYTGTSLETQLGTGFLAAVHPDDRGAVAAAWESAVAGRTPYQVEYRLRSQAGGYRWFSARGKPVWGRDGRVSRWLGVAIDIDARKRAEEALRQERSRLQAIIDNSPLLILVKDLAGRVVLANKAIFDNIQVPPRERFIGCSLFEAFPPEVAEARWLKDLAAMETEAPQRTEESIRHRDGTWHTYVTSRFPVHDIETRELLGICAVSTDISEQKAVEAQVQRLNVELERRVLARTAELERSNEALLESNSELRHFAHATAHDLKTPLRSIVGFAQLLQQATRDSGDGQLDSLSARVIDNARRLQVLIDDLLAYTRLDTLGLSLEPVDLQAVVGEVLATLAPLVEETGAEVGCGEMPRLSVNRSQIAQVFQNLIENGVKYNQSKPPRVSVRCDREGGEWLFAVTDNGIGIDPRHHERIFEIFRRLHTYHHIPGTGIGLALCRRIVARHGGRIWVESRPGAGSTFYFTLPVQAGGD